VVGPGRRLLLFPLGGYNGHNGPDRRGMTLRDKSNGEFEDECEEADYGQYLRSGQSRARPRIDDQTTMIDHTDDTAHTWRDLADQLTGAVHSDTFSARTRTRTPALSRYAHRARHDGHGTCRWLGHASQRGITTSVYTHSQGDALKDAAISFGRVVAIGVAG
jgi:hypothetical protein